MWVLDPANSPDLIRSLRRHAPELDVAWAGEGWRSLVAECHDALEQRFPDYRLLDIKQESGALAFRAFPRPGKGTWTQAEYAELLITDGYRDRSETVCEWCGLPGRRRQWRQVEELTLCDECDARFADPPTPRPGQRR